MSTNGLNEEYTIDTPENISIDFRIAGIGNRFIAALIDSALLAGILLVAQTLMLVAVAAAGNAAALFDFRTASWQQGWIMAAYALVSFSLLWGYFILFEWLWNGRTPGKRIANIRVVRMDGSPPRFLDIAVRNLVRIVDFLPFGYAVGLITMFFNRESRRLGDLAAGVIVVKDRGELRLQDLAGDAVDARQPAPHLSDDFAARYPGLRRMRMDDIELIQSSLHRYDAGRLEPALLTRLAHLMTQRVGGNPLAPTAGAEESRRRLLDILHAYRQRTTSTPPG